MPAIEVERLDIHYGCVAAVRGLSFTARAGHVTCVVGRNGAGKTSTIEALEGLRRPNSGRLSVLGREPFKEHRKLVARIGVMLQDGGIQPAIRVGEALRHAAALYPNPQPVPELAEQVGVAHLERRAYRSLSGGEQRRLALALALVGRPEVVFLDEPTAGVDPEGRVAIRGLIGALGDDGVTILLSSHELDEVERLADRVVMIDGGRLVAEGTVKELLRSPGTGGALTFRADTGLDVVAMGARLRASVTEVVPGEYRLDPLGEADAASGEALTNPQQVVAVTGWLAEQGVRLRDLRVGQRSLEDVFLAKLEKLDRDAARQDEASVS